MDWSKTMAVGYIAAIILGAVIGSSAGATFDLNTLLSAAGALGGLGAFFVALNAYRFAKKETHRWAEREQYRLIDEAITAAYQLSKLDEALREFYIERKGCSQINLTAEISATPHILTAKIRSLKEIGSLAGNELNIVSEINMAVQSLLTASEGFYFCKNHNDLTKQNGVFETGKTAYMRAASAHFELAKKIESLYPGQNS